MLRMLSMLSMLSMFKCKLPPRALRFSTPPKWKRKCLDRGTEHAWWTQQDAEQDAEHDPMQDVISAECDCLIYSDLNALAPLLRHLYPTSVAAGPVTGNHLTGCVLYVGQRKALTNVNRFLLECLQVRSVAALLDSAPHPCLLALCVPRCSHACGGTACRQDMCAWQRELAPPVLRGLTRVERATHHAVHSGATSRRTKNIWRPTSF